MSDMLNFLKVLCVVDPTVERQPAVERPAWLAKATGANIELLICFNDEFLGESKQFQFPMLAKIQANQLASCEVILEKLATSLRQDGVTISTSVLQDRSLHEGIVGRAAQCNVDQVPKDTHHHSALSCTLFSYTDWNQIRACPLHRCAVKPNSLTDKPVFTAAVDSLNDNDKPAALDREKLKQIPSNANDIKKCRSCISLLSSGDRCWNGKSICTSVDVPAGNWRKCAERPQGDFQRNIETAW